jgi:hypothetical protein
MVEWVHQVLFDDFKCEIHVSFVWTKDNANSIEPTKVKLVKALNNVGIVQLYSTRHKNQHWDPLIDEHILASFLH